MLQIIPSTIHTYLYSLNRREGAEGFKLEQILNFLDVLKSAIFGQLFQKCLPLSY